METPRAMVAPNQFFQCRKQQKPRSCNAKQAHKTGSRIIDLETQQLGKYEQIVIQRADSRAINRPPIHRILQKGNRMTEHLALVLVELTVENDHRQPHYHKQQNTQ